VLVDGEPGDWVLGPHRMTYPHQLVRRRGRAGRADWRAAADSCAPAVLRRVLAAREVDVLPWLRDDVRRRQRHAEALDSGLEPLRWDAALRSLERWRWHGLGIPTVRAVVRAYGAQPLQPLGDPAFVHALACWGGRVGLPSRTAAMRLLCGDLLPPEVLRRRSKATFNTQVFGAATRAFAERWDGSGVDPQRVDAERLRAEWLSPVPDARTLGLLQDAWLARRCLVQQVPA
jgi:asparagine synthase (glutamine-hydrolysing)